MAQKEFSAEEMDRLALDYAVMLGNLFQAGTNASAIICFRQLAEARILYYDDRIRNSPFLNSAETIALWESMLAKCRNAFDILDRNIPHFRSPLFDVALTYTAAGFIRAVMQAAKQVPLS